MLFWPIFHCGMEIGKEVITTLKIFINHSFVKHPNSMVWVVCMLTAHNCPKMKKSIPDMSLP